MESSASTLILTKLNVPAKRSRGIPRARLVNRLVNADGPGLVLICAPAGYGKTTLLAEWSRALSQKGLAIAWYALDAGDDSPYVFGAYLIASLTQALGPKNDLAQVAHQLQSSPEVDLQKVLPVVINSVASSDRNCVLILDDYHVIGSQAIHNAIAFLLEHLPVNMQIAIGSRSEPPLPLARLRARNQLLEMHLADLRFTQEEAAQFLSTTMELNLPHGLVAALEKRTEGWIAGLQLAALSLAGNTDKAGFIGSFRGGDRYLGDYLLEEILSRQPEEIRSFLLHSSIPDRFCAPLCDALLHQSSGSELIIPRLEQANLFVMPLDVEGTWFRYHPLFRDFLESQLRKAHPDLVSRLHRAASEWLAEHDYQNEAVDHAIKTRDWEYATALVEKQGIEAALRGDFSTLYRWSSAFPEEVMRSRPTLCLFQANALTTGFRRQNRERIEMRLRQVENAAEGQQDKEIGLLLMGQASTTRAVMEATTPDPTIDPNVQFRLAKRALDALSSDDPARPAVILTTGYAFMALHDAEAAFRAMEEAGRLAIACHNDFAFVEATFHRSRLAAVQGRLQQAADICVQRQIEGRAIRRVLGQEPRLTGCLDIALGCIQVEQNQLEDAERNLLKGFELVRWGMNPYYSMIACLELFRLRKIQGRREEANEYLDQLEELWPDVAFCARGTRLLERLQNSPGDPNARSDADAWCREIDPPTGEAATLPGMGPFGAAEAYYMAYLAWARIQIAIGNSRAALPYLEKQIDLARAHGLTSRVIELSLVEAQGWQAEGKARHARELLNQAVSAGVPAGYLQLFNQGETLTRLLIDSTRHGPLHDAVKRILSAIETSTSIDRDHDSTLKNVYVALTERELAVLRLMEEGSSNQLIAEQLVITIGTVKSHVNHILSKLNAANRTEAVARSRELGLL